MFSPDFLHDLGGKRVVVMGLGLHGGGLATTLWLLRHGARVLVTDLRDAETLRPSLAKLPRNPRLALVLGRHRFSDFSSADLIVANPGVPATSPYLARARSHGIPIINEATIFFALCPCPVIGVTGTKGKSTVSTLIRHLLLPRYPGVLLAGNIRTTALLHILDRLTSRSLVVAELSSWQLEGLPCIRVSPHIAVLTNLLDDHLNQYPSRAAYFAAKDAIWEYQTPNDAVVLNRDNPSTFIRGKRLPSRRFWFSHQRFAEENGAYLSHGWFCVRINGVEERIALRTASSLIGEQNVSNMLAALMVARICGVPKHALATAVRTFRGVPGRLEVVRTFRGVKYVNDTTATAPIATIAALASFNKGRIVLIAGGVDKKLPYGELAGRIRGTVRSLILLPGTATTKLKRHLGRFPSTEAGSMREAVRAAANAARRGDVVLLSPGAASFGLFLHEFDRGDQFLQAVRRLTS